MKVCWSKSENREIQNHGKEEESIRREKENKLTFNRMKCVHINHNEKSTLEPVQDENGNLLNVRCGICNEAFPIKPIPFETLDMQLKVLNTEIQQLKWHISEQNLSEDLVEKAKKHVIDMSAAYVTISNINDDYKKWVGLFHEGRKKKYVKDDHYDNRNNHSYYLPHDEHGQYARRNRR
jgi:hypothetical protein